ncbi:MAG: hypothetical protein EOO53_11495 [Gammaproteobacteria bacterium]|nr:MAG: hypothetical protein EOO53_11495 [Gammaproteobacteria bacterium]
MQLIEIINENDYTFGSSDNKNIYSFEMNLEPEYRPSAIHGVKVNGESVAVFGAAGGKSVIHGNSIITVNEKSYLAVGQFVVCFISDPFEFLWCIGVDSIACFGVHYNKLKNAFISHGEISIVRFNESGNIIWSSDGADIFTGNFSLLNSHIEVFDFNDSKYRIDYDTGSSECI